MNSFWDKKEIIGLAPMDGVTDAAYRYIADTYGKPDLLITEFVSVEGATTLLDAFIHHKSTIPTIAQIYGTELEAFYKMTIIACELGFDGIDINMGCPDKSVTGRGAGAGLIRSPKHAQDIVKTVKKAVVDWSDGQSMINANIRPKVYQAVERLKENMELGVTRKILPVSVKTRMGFDTPIVEDWISNLLEVEPVNITLHGRTLKQMYSGLADWEEIGKASRLAKGSKTYLMGNGDIKSIKDAKEKIKTYGLHGVLIGRASFGNPWLFQEIEPTTNMRLTTALEHCIAFQKYLPEGHFISLRKHMAWYCKGFDGAAEVRAKLMSITSVEDVERILKPLIEDTFAVA